MDPSQRNVPDPPPRQLGSGQAGTESDQGETEDEEIKMNCIGGQIGMHDSDDFSSDAGGDVDSDEDGEEDDDVHTPRYVVSFLNMLVCYW